MRSKMAASLGSVSDGAAKAPPPSECRPVSPGMEIDAKALLRYLREHVPGFPRDCEAIDVYQFKHGQSNPTYCVIASPLHQYVVRKKPPGPLLPSAHLVEREFEIMNALQGSRVPVPRVYCLCTDTSVLGTAFFVMEFVQGRIFKDPNLPGLSRADKFAVYSAFCETLAQLHKLDFRAVLPASSFQGRTEGYVERTLSRWEKQFVAAKTDEVPEVDRMMKLLRAKCPSGAEAERVTIVHGDFRLDNLIFHPKQCRVLAVLDWELWTIGHPTADLAYACLPYVSPPGTLMGGVDAARAGVPPIHDFVAAYARSVGLHGGVRDLEFFMGLSAFRMASILQGVYKRSLQGNASNPRAREFKSIVPRIAELGCRILAEGLEAVPASRGADATGQTLAAAQLQLFKLSDRFWQLRETLLRFMDSDVYPNEATFDAQHAALAQKAGHTWVVPPIVETLKAKARSLGLWNLFLTNSAHHSFGNGLSNLEYAPLCEITGRSLQLAPEACNCSAPDTGNMEVLALYGTPQQQEQWLKPLMEGKIRSCFGMTEPMVASSDATNVECRIERDGDEYVINGRKWWTSGAMDPRCKLCILMGKTDLRAPPHKQQSMILVPMDAPGVSIVRPLHVFGYDDAPHGHAEMVFRNVRVPASNILLGEGRGFEIAQGRLGPGRIHHCMRLIGIAERALEIMIRRVHSRFAFGAALASKGTIIADIARSRVEIDQCRLLTLQAAAIMDQFGNKAARQQIAMIKVAAPEMVLRVLDRAIQAHGGMGVCQDTPLPRLWANCRTLRLADGPDEVHLEAIGKEELARARL